VPKYDTTTSTYPPVTVVVPTTEAPSTSVEVIEPPVPSTTAAPTTTITELGIDTVHTTTTVGPVVKEGTPLPRTGEDMGDGLEVGGLLVAGGSVAAAIARRKK